MATQESGSGSQLNHGALSTSGIVFLVLAAVTPIGAVAGPVALGLVLGNGAGLPGTYLFAGIILLLFAVGYAAMSHHVTNAGAFYAYVTKGLGRPAGSAAAFVALIAYNAIFCSVVGAFAFFASGLSASLPLMGWGRAIRASREASSPPGLGIGRRSGPAPPPSERGGAKWIAHLRQCRL